MTDAHCHVSCGDGNVRELLVGRDFFGVHPWEAIEGIRNKEEGRSAEFVVSWLRGMLEKNPNAGVGEIGLDRLKVREIPPLMRELFEQQLALAIELRRPVVLHGAKCWGQVVREVRRNKEEGRSADGSPFLFHGFSRSDGLIPDIVALGGFISVGPAVLNDHAVNYRELVKKIPLERLLVETDRTEACGGAPRTSPPTEVSRPCPSVEVGADVPGRPCPSIVEVLAKTAELRGMSAAELEAITDRNADAFMGGAR